MVKRLNIILIFTLAVISFTSSEEYKTVEVAFIQWGEADSLLGYIPGSITNEGTPEEMVRPGFGPRSWDVDLEGNIYIVDFVKSRIVKYNKDAKYLKDVGRWNNEENILRIKANSGRTIILSRKSSFGKKENVPYYNVYMEEIGDVAVDGKGNIYVIPYPSETYVLKFSSEGKLLEIIDQFGEYGQKDIKMGIGQIFSDAYGNVFVDVSLKSTYIFAQFNEDGELVSITEKKIYPQDAKGNLYGMLPDGKKWAGPDINVSFSINNPKRSTFDTLTIYFEQPTYSGVIFKGTDGAGNIYLRTDDALLKYDQQCNLLSRIQRKPDKKRTFEIPMPAMAAVSKIMANGDIYNAYMSDQGFVVVKHELQQETKGQILKPAYIPEDMKKK